MGSISTAKAGAGRGGLSMVLNRGGIARSQRSRGLVSMHENSAKPWWKPEEGR